MKEEKNTINIQIREYNISQVDEFSYFGSKISKSGYSKKRYKSRLDQRPGEFSC